MTVISRGLEKAYHTNSYTLCDMPVFLCFILWQPYLMISSSSPLKSSSVYTSYLPVPRLQNPDYEGLYNPSKTLLLAFLSLYKISI